MASIGRVTYDSAQDRFEIDVYTDRPVIVGHTSTENYSGSSCSLATIGQYHDITGQTANAPSETLFVVGEDVIFQQGFLIIKIWDDNSYSHCQEGAVYPFNRINHKIPLRIESAVDKDIKLMKDFLITSKNTLYGTKQNKLIEVYDSQILPVTQKYIEKLKNMKYSQNYTFEDVDAVMKQWGNDMTTIAEQIKGMGFDLTVDWLGHLPSNVGGAFGDFFTGLFKGGGLLILAVVAVIAMIFIMRR